MAGTYPYWALDEVSTPMRPLLEDLRSQREGLLSLGYWALLTYRFGHARLSIRNRWLRLPLTITYTVFGKITEILCGITIGPAACIGRRLRIEHHGCIVIHGAARIGDDCVIRHGVTIGNAGVRDPAGAPTIGNRVDIGAGAKLIGRIHIGDDVVVGANAVVVKDVPSNVVVGGIPARILRNTGEPDSSRAPGSVPQLMDG